MPGSYCLSCCLVKFSLCSWQTRLALCSQRSSGLCLPRARIKGLYHHAQLLFSLIGFYSVSQRGGASLTPANPGPVEMMYLLKLLSFGFKKWEFCWMVVAHTFVLSTCQPGLQNHTRTPKATQKNPVWKNKNNNKKGGNYERSVFKSPRKEPDFMAHACNPSNWGKWGRGTSMKVEF